MKNPFKIKGNSKKELLRLLDAYQQAIDFNIICSITDTQGKIFYVNNRFCEVSKFYKQELLGQNHRIVNSGYHSKEFLKICGIPYQRDKYGAVKLNLKQKMVHISGWTAR